MVDNRRKALAPINRMGGTDTMKQVTKMSRAVGTIEGIYNSTNTDIWGEELPPVIITVQSSPGSFGHGTGTSKNGKNTL